jgi:hypothetical protein
MSCLIPTVLFVLPAGGLAQPLRLERAKMKANLAGGALVDTRTDSALSEFDQALLGVREPSGLADARNRLDRILTRAIDGVDAVCALDDGQKRKLGLAGRGDIKQLHDRIEGLRQRFENARRDGADEDVFNSIRTETSAVRLILKSGPFDDDSRFAWGRGILNHR